ncbi:MAG: dephospho-CoA kinase [Anaerolineae bacterium]|nr:dephospho-CoA kinase [Anaerolineae bacterium]
MGRWANKYVIGLTGNIAMGKSVVRKRLESLGAYTTDADGLAHLVMAPGAPAYQPVIDWFGRWLVGSDGKIDRAKLGAIVFSHPDALARLESLTHPIILQGIDTLIRRAQQPIAVIEAIKLVDGPLGQAVDAIWVVDAVPQVQLERLMKRGLSEADAKRRIIAQNPQRDKLAKATVRITNNGSLEDVWAQIDSEWNKLMLARGLQSQQSDEVSVSVVQVMPPPTGQLSAAKVVGTPGASTPPTTETAAVTPAPAATSNLAAAPGASSAPSVIRPITPTAPLTSAAAGSADGISGTSAAPVTPAVETPAITAAAADPQPEVEAAPISMSIKIRRGMPQTAEDIARLINQGTGKSLKHIDIISRFGEKSYLLAEVNNRIVGLAGFHVDNLIARMDELLIEPEMPQAPLAKSLLEEVEKASKALQSEIGLMFVPNNAPSTLTDVFFGMGYQKMDVETIKNPAWREAAEESQPPDTQVFAKKLGERVLKPL